MYHYHTAKCPHCDGSIGGVWCNLDNCTTATISLEPFVSSDGFVAIQVKCHKTDKIYYVDLGNRDLPIKGTHEN